MAAKVIYTAEHDGRIYQRASDRLYTHAAIHISPHDGKYYATFHSSEMLARKTTHDSPEMVWAYKRGRKVQVSQPLPPTAVVPVTTDQKVLAHAQRLSHAGTVPVSERNLSGSK